MATSPDCVRLLEQRGQLNVSIAKLYPCVSITEALKEGMMPKPKVPRKLTTAEAAAILGVNRTRIRQFVLEGRLHATKFGRDLALDEAEVREFQRLDRPSHRPRSK